MEMRERIIAVGLDTATQPDARFFVGVQKQLGKALHGPTAT
jgi:hypothetical protein